MENHWIAINCHKKQAICLPRELGYKSGWWCTLIAFITLRVCPVTHFIRNNAVILSKNTQDKQINFLITCPFLIILTKKQKMSYLAIMQDLKGGTEDEW